ncbi:hypothetical protein ACTJJ7_13150 [Phyllobacterium sp. 22229]|uniref:hypothetical protein n=1 Tax=Phyllobacterium sp. 22229 TaxID=3453895 RepID=UPI003F857EBC
MGQETLVRFAVAGASPEAVTSFGVNTGKWQMRFRSFLMRATHRTYALAACTVCIGTAKIGIGRPFKRHDRACLKK